MAERPWGRPAEPEAPPDISISGLIQGLILVVLYGCGVVFADDSSGFYREDELPGVIAALAASDPAEAARLLYQDERAAWLWLPDRKQGLLRTLRQLQEDKGGEAVLAEIDRRADCCLRALTQPARTASAASYAAYNSHQVRRYREMLDAGRWRACVQDFRGDVVPGAAILRQGASDPQVIADYLRDLEILRAVRDSGLDSRTAFEAVDEDHLYSVLTERRLLRVIDDQVDRDSDRPIEELTTDELFLICRYALGVWEALEQLDPVYAGSYWRTRLAD